MQSNYVVSRGKNENIAQVINKMLSKLSVHICFHSDWCQQQPERFISILGADVIPVLLFM